jgi:hypothetical protein
MNAPLSALVVLTMENRVHHFTKVRRLCVRPPGERTNDEQKKEKYRIRTPVRIKHRLKSIQWYNSHPRI